MFTQARIASAVLALLALGFHPAFAATIPVVAPSDAGAGSLRAAIQAANGAPGPHRIVFNIPFAGVQKIMLLSPLPDVLNQTAIDATTQPGYFSVPTIAGTPIVELDGTLAGVSAVNGITLRAHGSSVRGLSIGYFSNYGIAVLSADACTLAANHIGCDASGTAARPNFFGVYLDGDSDVIGGPNAKSRNVISGNQVLGLFALNSADGKILGNYVGTNAAGTAGLANAGGGGVVNESGNYEIGGYKPGEGNLISGNGSVGLAVINDFVLSTADGHFIGGNWIGTDVYGTSAIANLGDGIYLRTQYTDIGHPFAPNVISGNRDRGIYIEGPTGHDLGIYDNLVGVTFDATRPLGNGAEGVWASNSGGHDIAHNVIAGNAGIGLLLSGPASGFTTLEENYIGTNRGGAVKLGNLSTGLWIESANTDMREGNIIAYNQFGGVIVQSGGASPLRGNRIYGNEWLDVDLLDGTGLPVTPNDLFDTDGGANGLQNFPELSSVTYGAGQLRVQGSLHSTQNSAFNVDVYSSPECHPTGYGGGETWIGVFPVMTNGAGDGPFDVTFLAPAISGRVFTATATSPEGTSEFSLCYFMPPTVAVEPPVAEALEFSLGAARPQPARGPMRIPFTIAHEARVTLRIFDAAGRAAETLLDETRAAGTYEAVWKPRRLAAGVYWYRLDAFPTDATSEVRSFTRRAVILP